MPTDPAVSAETARLISARDEALCRYTQHLCAVELRKSRWSTMLSRGGSNARVRAASASAVPFLVKPATHAH